MKRKLFSMALRVFLFSLIMVSCNSNTPPKSEAENQKRISDSIKQAEIDKAANSDGRVIVSESETEKAEGDSTNN